MPCWRIMHAHLNAAAGLLERPLWCRCSLGTAMIAPGGTVAARALSECCCCLALAASAALRRWRRVSAGLERRWPAAQLLWWPVLSSGAGTVKVCPEKLCTFCCLPVVCAASWSMLICSLGPARLYILL